MMSDLKPTVVSLGILMPLFATLAVCLRIHSRRIKKMALAADDYLVLSALVYTFPLIVITFTKSDQVFSIALSIVSVLGMLLSSELSQGLPQNNTFSAAFLGNLGGHLSVRSAGASASPEQIIILLQVCLQPHCSLREHGTGVTTFLS